MIATAMARALKWDDLELLEFLGSGQSGSVYRARLRSNAAGVPIGSYVAVKRYKTSMIDEAGFIERLFRD